ncbi:MULTISPECIES: acyl carrier protein [Streptomyces]|uniref:Phosphopantetheine attachment site n=3 Tax=Streptomyces TaxID=1883 RepID=A0A7H1QCU6_9ACTN|nr:MULTISPECIES: acyl carrier protein [Streptomyces]ADN64236.1 putative peptidyl carrier protein [Streptomyces rochei subsp. volubilis]MBA9050696.1 acyl carrier protein [Streptomyces murinus]QNT98126.1 Phosphopantetheine attachment site [Streptomyces griseofuscus]BAC76479.1 probable peptidyl carrier protein [Streptomyces rochei]
MEANELKAVEGTVLEAWCGVLGLDTVDPDVPFAALGGDSMRAVRVLSRLWRELGVELPVHALGNDTTAAELATAVHARLNGQAA